MKRLGVFLRAIAAGVMISIGGAAYLSCDNKYVGAVAFCVGLISVVLLKMELYTGKVGYLVTEGGSFGIDTLISVAGNLVGCAAVGLLASPIGKVTEICGAKLTKGALPALFDAAMCGVLIYVCVEIYKRHKTVVGILFCVPAFILCGFEHSVADMFYFFNARSFSPKSALFVALVIVGNALGAVLMHGLLTLAEKIAPKKETKGE